MKEHLPDWPALMPTLTAAEYLGGLSEASFEGLAARYGVRAVDMGLRRRMWRRRDLDGLIDRLPVRDPQSPPREPERVAPAASDADHALGRVGARVARLRRS